MCVFHPFTFNIEETFSAFLFQYCEHYIMIISFIIVAATFATITWPRSKRRDYFSCRKRTSRRGKQHHQESCCNDGYIFYYFFTDHNIVRDI